MELRRQLLVSYSKLREILEQSAVLADKEVLKRLAKLLVGDVGVRVGEGDLVIGIEVGSRELDVLRSASDMHGKLTFMISNSRLSSS